MRGVRIKSVAVEEFGGFKADTEGRTLEYYAAAFGNRDNQGDVVDRGAFAKTIAERLPRRLIKVFRNHSDLVGMPLLMREDEFGLLVRAKVDKTPVGDETLEQCASGSLAHASFMYRVMQHRLVDEGGEETLHLTELKVFETGPVVWPANEMTQILAVAKGDRSSHAALMDFALADLLEPAKIAMRELADRKSWSSAERQEVRGLLADLTPFIERLQSIDEDHGGPEPQKATTRRHEQGPESESTTTPDEESEVAVHALCSALDSLRALASQRRAAVAA